MSDELNPLELFYDGELRVYCHGDRRNPPLVCVHGLMGDTIDFVSFYQAWGKSFFLLIPEIAPKGKDTGYMIASAATGHPSLVYEGSVDKIHAFLAQSYPGQAVLFTGISLGGKLCIEYAGRYPETFKGAVVTDVGIGPLCGSDLYHFLKDVIPSINLSQPWKELKEELKQKIPDRMLRLLVQSSISYPVPHSNQAVIKGNMRGFVVALEGSSFEDQHWVLPKLAAPIVILKATSTSAIKEADYRIMRADPRFFVCELPGANHFIQINNKKEYEQLGLKGLQLMAQGKLVGRQDDWHTA